MLATMNIIATGTKYLHGNVRFTYVAMAGASRAASLASA